MKLSIVFLNALVATRFATSHAVSPKSLPALLSPDPSPSPPPPLLQKSASFLSRLPWHPRSESSPPGTIVSSRASPDDEGYASAYAEAQALGLSGGFRAIPTTATTRRRFNIAHGTLMALTFTLWFPLGAVVMHSTHRAGLHAAVQAFAYANAIAGLGLGVWLGRNVRYLDYAHTVIGMAVLAALLFQLALGLWTHWRFVVETAAGMEKEKEKDMSMSPAHGTGTGTGTGKGIGLGMQLLRRVFTRGFAHRWLGRCLIALGIVNGGLGLKLAQNTRGGEIAYGIVAGLVGATYLSLLLIRTWKRFRMTKDEPMVPPGSMLT